MSQTNFFYVLLVALFVWSCEKQVVGSEKTVGVVPVNDGLAAKSKCSGCVHYDAGLINTERKALALKFAPQLRFDRNARTFPQDAAIILANSGGKTNGNCLGKLNDNGISDSYYDGDIAEMKQYIYSYYTVHNDINYTHYFISYWWAYWRQPNCIRKTGGHDYDWEHITVKVKASGQTPIGAYYAQHSDGQTYNWNALEKIGDHPIVYVGRQAHPSYKNKSTFRIACARDYANPQGTEDYFSIWNASDRLVALRCDDTWAAFSGSWGKPGPGPLHRTYDVW